jgi:guanylate kinase
MKKGKIIIMSGPSGSGKTTLFKKLLAETAFKNQIIRSISVTTRHPRPGEKNHRDYIFVTPKMFLFKKRQGHFLESEEVFGNYYGTPAKNVLNLIKSGKNVLLCIDVEGAKHVCQRFSKAVRIFIKTSSFKVLRNRLTKRGSEEKATVELRLKRAQAELKEASSFDYVIVNDELPLAYRKLKNIIKRIIE